MRFDGIFPGAAPVTGVEFAADHGVAPAYTVLNSDAAYTPTQLVQNHGHWVVGKHDNAIQDDLRFNFTQGAHDLTFGVCFADYAMDDRWSLGNLLLMDVADRGRLFATYTHVEKRFGNDENTIDLPAYDKLDAGVSFDINSSFTVQIVGDNLTDEVGLTESNPRTDVGAGGIGETFMARPLFGRSVLASATVRF